MQDKTLSCILKIRTEGTPFKRDLAVAHHCSVYGCREFSSRTVRRFVCVYLCVFCVFFHAAYLLYYWERGGVDPVGLKPNS